MDYIIKNRYMISTFLNTIKTNFDENIHILILSTLLLWKRIPEQKYCFLPLIYLVLYMHILKKFVQFSFLK